MAANIASTWENALLATADVTGAPTSIFLDAAAGATGVTAQDFIDLEATVLGNDVPLEGSRMAYLFNKDAYSAIHCCLSFKSDKDKDLKVGDVVSVVDFVATPKS